MYNKVSIYVTANKSVKGRLPVNPTNAKYDNIYYDVPVVNIKNVTRLISHNVNISLFYKHL